MRLAFLRKADPWMLVLLLAYLVHGLIYIPAQSITTDEWDHYNYASRFVQFQPDKVRTYDDASCMPVTAVNTIPRIVRQVLQTGFHRSDGGVRDIIEGRYVTLFLTLITGLIIYAWARSLFGLASARLALFFFAFSPNLIAHSGLVGTDAYAVLVLTWACWAFYRFKSSGSFKTFLELSLAVGIAQITKQSLTWLYPLFFLMLFIPGKPELKGAWKHVVAFFLIQILVINAGFLFRHSSKPLNEYKFESSFMNRVQSGLPGFFTQLPFPAPSPYLLGMDKTKQMDEAGSGNSMNADAVYLLGKTSKTEGFAYYYPVVMFFKTPISLLICFVSGLILILRRRQFRKDILHLVIPIVFFLIYFDLFYNSQVGIRHILIIYPLIMILASSAASAFLLRWLVPLLLWQMASFYTFLPQLIPYTNEFVINKTKAYRIMADSNLDYKQATGRLQRFLREHPDFQYAPAKPQPGNFVISVNHYLDLNGSGNYKWIQAYKPTGNLAFTYLLIHVPVQK